MTTISLQKLSAFPMGINAGATPKVFVTEKVFRQSDLVDQGDIHGISGRCHRPHGLQAERGLHERGVICLEA